MIMKKIVLFLTGAAFGLGAMTGCIKEIVPQGGSVSADQAMNAPGAFENFVAAITTTLAGQPLYVAHYFSDVAGELSGYATDFGLTSNFLQRDLMGMDMVPSQISNYNHFSSFYSCGSSLSPNSGTMQVTWYEYFSWIGSCNRVIGMVSDPENASETQREGLGIAYAMRAMHYMDLARMYAQKTYGVDKEAEAVPILTEDPTIDASHNPRVTNEVMWDFIISDLDKAEEYLANYRRSDKTTPDLSVIYGLKARAYLTMERWADAVTYARKAQAGYTAMTGDQYTDRATGFNTENASWMLKTTFHPNDPCIIYNDGDSSWGSWMCLELNYLDGYGCGYAANYGHPMLIDRHLYETIPATDFRKKCYVDFSLNELRSKAEIIEALADYSDYPEYLYDNLITTGERHEAGGAALKFRLAGGAAGHEDQYIGFVVELPLMRVEEMILIEAEALGMQAGHENEGIALLTSFAQSRDPQYVYGTHNEAYYNATTSAFQNECWWQRRVEFWGEGFATFDIKRLNKGIIRSYAGSNHVENYRWNVNEVPAWMTLCFVSTEARANFALNPNPTPIAPTGDSAEYIW